MSRNWKNGGRYRENKYKRSMSTPWPKRVYGFGLYMSIYRHFVLPPVTGKLQSFTADKRSVNGKSINPIFA